MNKRTVILMTFIAFCFLAVHWRLFDIMLLRHKNFATRAQTQHSQKIEIQVRRGIIYDRKGKEFAVNIDQKSLYCDPSKVNSVKRTAYRLSKITGVNRQKLVKRLKSRKRFVWIKRKINADIMKAVERKKIEGTGFIPEADRVYPRGILASHITGFVNIDNRGLSGVEKEYDTFLTSRGGKVTVTTDARGNILLSGEEIESSGNSIVLTIDEVLQYIVEDALNAAMKQWKAKSASVIMMNPYTGEILALANRPTFNPNSPGRYSASSRRNRAITDVFEPGSTFKIVTAASVLEEKLFDMDSLFDCSNGYIEVGRKKVRDEHKHKVLSFSEVLQKSSNVGIIMMAKKLGKERLYGYAKKFGFGVKTGFDLPGEVSGWIKPPEKWSRTSIGAIPMGQEVAVTSMQVLRAYSAIANGGYLVTPFVVSKIISPEGNVVYHRQMSDLERILCKRTTVLLRGMLEKVTQQGGTALEASIEGNTIAGKTGTAQIFDTEKNRYSHERFVSSFVGFFPSDKPRLAMIVVLTEPEGEIFGGKVAGPVFKKIADRALAYLNIPMDEEPLNNIVYVSGGNAFRRYY